MVYTPGTTIPANGVVSGAAAGTRQAAPDMEAAIERLNDMAAANLALTSDITSVARIVATSTSPSWAKAAATYVGDGTADQVEINQAIADLPATGGLVLLAPGDFQISAPITVDGKHGVTFAGSGTGYRSNSSQASIGTRLSVVSGFTGAAVLQFLGTSALAPLAACQIRDLTVDGNAIGTGVDGILFRAHSSNISHVQVHRCTGNGIRVKGYGVTADGASVDWATYDTLIEACLSSYNTGAGVYFDNLGQDCHAVGNILHDNGHGFRIGAGSEQLTNNHTYSNGQGGGYNVWFDSNGSRTKIVNLKCEQSQQHGIYIDNSAGTGTSDIQIVGCNFKNNGVATANTWDHIYIGGTSSGQHGRVTIVGCNFSWTSGNLPRYGINAATSQTANLVVTGCNLGANTHYGTKAVNISPSATVFHAGNQVPASTAARLENFGVASVADGGTITHDLAKTPGYYSISATGAGHIANITAVSSTTLTVALKNNDGTAVTTAENVTWRAEV